VPLTAAPRDTQIQNIGIDNSRPWQQEHMQRLEAAYGSAPYFKEVWEVLESTLTAEWSSLSLLNIHLIQSLARYMGMNASFIQASELQKGLQERLGAEAAEMGQKSELIFNICRELDAKCYITGDGSRGYLQEADFFKAGMVIDYVAPITFDYRQQFPQMEFIPYLSIIDLLFNEGFNRFCLLAEKLLVGAVECRMGEKVEQ